MHVKYCEILNIKGYLLIDLLLKRIDSNDNVMLGIREAFIRKQDKVFCAPTV